MSAWNSTHFFVSHAVKGGMVRDFQKGLQD